MTTSLAAGLRSEVGDGSDRSLSTERSRFGSRPGARSFDRAPGPAAKTHGAGPYDRQAEKTDDGSARLLTEWETFQPGRAIEALLAAGAGRGGGCVQRGGRCSRGRGSTFVTVSLTCNANKCSVLGPAQIHIPRMCRGEGGEVGEVTNCLIG